ncbi:hypothetical protein [Streptomyces acidiscabies]|uniref:Uncharacterized protein n=1 Tax=Streptomyces acidiscabies TaxID=42234 RepID=A0A0L0K9M8_9ACTN|nr:hypothetical protein [Streptomyces acidiscabies]KND34556.1 hypothetical protein IQ63_15970 [Streptomyces acidiscabies]
MILRTDGTAHSAAVAAAVPRATTQDRTIPAYASSSQVPDGLMVRAVQQEYAATRVTAPVPHHAGPAEKSAPKHPTQANGRPLHAQAGESGRTDHSEPREALLT